MKVELQSYLKKKFPQLYPVDFSFECGTGWFRIILWLSRYLEMYVMQQNECAQKHQFLVLFLNMKNHSIVKQ